MPERFQADHSSRRARHRLFLRTGAWAAVALSVVILVLLWAFTLPVFQGFVPGSALLIGTGVSILVYVAALSIPLMQRESLKTLRIPPLTPEEPEPWAAGVLQSRRRRWLRWVGLPLGLSMLATLVMVLMRSRGIIHLPSAVSLVPTVWMALLLLTAAGIHQLFLHRWLADGRDTAARRLLRHGPAMESTAQLAVALRVLGHPQASEEALTQLFHPGASRTVGSHTVALAAAAEHDPAYAADAFLALHNAVPELPHGALGYADTVLSVGTSAVDASRYAYAWSRRNLRHHHLALYAQANLARSYALDGLWDQAVALADEVIALAASQPVRRRAALLHRVAMALAPDDAARAQALLEQVAILDPGGDIGQRAGNGRPPSAHWP